jgi:hypothetical protein
MKAKEFDKKFDSGESIVQYLELERTARPGQEQRRVNVDFPAWMISQLDREAKRLGVPRQSLIKIWIAEKLQSTWPDKSRGRISFKRFLKGFAGNP